MRTLKYGDRREDGAVFVGWHKRGDKSYEHWMSEAAWLRKRAVALLPGGSTHRANQLFKQKKADDVELARAVNAQARAAMKNHRRAHPEKIMLTRAKTRAKRKGIPFDLQVSDIVIPDTCPVLGIKLVFGESLVGKPVDGSPSLDRIDNTLGYTKDNVVVVSLRANQLKRDATLDELHKLVSFYSKLSEK